jgi:hypothetical protein
MKRGFFVLTVLALLVGAVAASQVAGAGTARTAVATRYVNDDNLGPGSCQTPNFNTIQAAINASANGDTIIVCPGTYNENVIVNKGVRLIGSSVLLTTAKCRDRAGTPATNTSTKSVVQGGGGVDVAFFVTANDVRIRNFTLQNAAIGVQVGADTVDLTQVKYNVFQSNTIGVSLRGEDGLYTQNCFRENNRAGAASGNGIYTDTVVKRAEISMNVFWGHDSSGVNLNGNGAGSVDDLRIQFNSSFDDSDFLSMAGVTDTRITSNSVDGTDGGSAVYLQANNHFIDIKKNTVKNSDDEAIAVDAGGGARSDGLLIAENVLTVNATDGIAIRSDSLNNSLIIKNTVTNNGDDGVEIENDNDGIAVVNNTLKPNTGHDCFDGNDVRGENIWYNNTGLDQNQDGLCDGATTI